MVRLGSHFGMAALLFSLIGLSAMAHSAPIAVEKIFVADFEEQPVGVLPRIEFVSDRTQIFSAPGETRTAEVRVLDASGNLIADPAIDWSSSDGALLSVSGGAPGEAQLESAGSWAGSLTFEATYAPLGLSVSGQANMAHLAPQTVLIPSSWVLEALGDRFNEHTVVLERNGTTEDLNVDDIVVSGDAAGVSVRILSFAIDSNTVRLQAEPASVSEAFEAYSSTVSGAPVRVMVEARESSSTITTYSSETDEILSRQSLPGRSLLDSVECGGGLELGTNISFSTLALEINLQPKTIADINLFSEDLVEIGMSGSLRAAAQVEVNATAGVSLNGECSVDIPNLALPGVPLYILTIAPRIDPSLVVRASAAAETSAGWVPISGLERTWSFDSGVRYTTAAGWNPFNSFNSSSPEPGSSIFSLSGEFSLEAEAGVNVGVGLNMCLAACSELTEFANAEFIHLFGGPYWRFSLGTPLDPANPAYLGPEQSIGVGAEASAGLEVSFFESGFLRYIPVGGSAGISFPIFSEQFELVSTPSLAGSLTCSPNCSSMPKSGGTLDLQMTASSGGTGTAEFWMGPAGGSLSLLGTAAFDAGQATGSFPTGTLAEGTYEIYPRLGLDGALFWFTSTWPIGSSGALGQFTVETDTGNTFTDCADCPTMVNIPAGTFVQGSPPDEPERESNEGPQRPVNVPAFAMGETEVTFDQWDACVADGGCSHNPDDYFGWGRGDRPVIDVDWNDAQEYVTWLSNQTGEDYRLPSESEWEYATRAGTTGRFNTGDCITTDQANFNGELPVEGCPTGVDRNQTLPVASFPANSFGLYDTHGNVAEWVQDCWNLSYEGAPTDGSAWLAGFCSAAVLRGGGIFPFGADDLRSGNRNSDNRGSRRAFYGLRVARSVAL